MMDGPHASPAGERKRREARLIGMKKRLDVKELQILQSEVERKKKSTVITYGLWFYGSFFGLHKFYLGKVQEGILYVIGPAAAVLFLVVGMAGVEHTNGGSAVLGLVGIAGLAAYAIWWVVDFFTIPRQVRGYNEGIEFEIIEAILGSGRAEPGVHRGGEPIIPS